MVIKENSTFLKATGLEPHHQIAQCHIQKTRRWEDSNLSRDMQSVYQTTQENLLISNTLQAWDPNTRITNYVISAYIHIYIYIYICMYVCMYVY